jgi:septal ring-binding cell division protein DamX
VVEAEGWRVPLYLGGALVALAIIGVIVAIVALSGQKQEVPTGTPTPVASVPPGATVSPIPTTSAIPTVSAVPTVSAEPTVSPEPSPSPEASPTETATAEPSTGSFPGWTGSDGDYTIIIASEESQSKAEAVATKAQNDNGLTVGILNSDDYSSLNGGYYVVFSGTYSSKSDAEADLDSVRDNYSDAYIKSIKT